MPSLFRDGWFGMSRPGRRLASGDEHPDLRPRPFRPRPRAGAHRADQRTGGRGIPPPRRSRRSARLPPLLVRRAPQHAGGGLDHTSRARRRGRRAHPAHPSSDPAASCCRTTRPLVVAEQFAALEALAPGRIDLGIGRASGVGSRSSRSCCVRAAPRATSSASPSTCATSSRSSRATGASLRFTSGGTYDVHATPAATTVPEVWLLGSSDYSAQLAASLGLPYVFANHFSGTGLERALDLYRTSFVPSAELAEPRTFLTANVLVAPTAEEAEERALPYLRMTARLRTNKPLIPLETIEYSIAHASDFDGLARIGRWRRRARPGSSGAPDVGRRRAHRLRHAARRGRGHDLADRRGVRLRADGCRDRPRADARTPRGGLSAPKRIR